MKAGSAFLIAFSLHAAAGAGAMLAVSADRADPPEPKPVEIKVNTLAVVQFAPEDVADEIVPEAEPEPIRTAPPAPPERRPIEPPPPPRPEPEPVPVVEPAPQPDPVALAPSTITLRPEPAAPAPSPPRPTTAMPVREPVRTAALQPPTARIAPPSSAPAPKGPAQKPKPLSKKGKRAQDRYLGELMAWLAAHRDYPPDLKKNKIEGTVRVRFTISRDGTVSAIAVAKSSGHPGLDEAALAVLRRANPVPGIPKAMEREKLSLTLPIEFSLITE